MGIYIYNQGFRYFELGFGSAAGQGVGDGGNLDRAGGQHRFHAVAADPADSEEADARARQKRNRCALRICHCHNRMIAFTKPSGLSRVASSASANRSSG